jgi:hypothetical protein
MGNACNIHDPADDKFYYCPDNSCPCNGSSTHRGNDDYKSICADTIDDITARYTDSDDYNPAYIAAFRDRTRNNDRTPHNRA